MLGAAAQHARLALGAQVGHRTCRRLARSVGAGRRSRNARGTGKASESVVARRALRSAIRPAVDIRGIHNHGFAILARQNAEVRFVIPTHNARGGRIHHARSARKG